ncbi:aldo/keto reductase [Candidatus Bipolaricaulota bacterium]
MATENTHMQYRTLGRTNLEVSEIGLGTEFLLGLEGKDAIGVVHEALESGINYVDMFWAHPEFRDNMGAALRGQRKRALITAHLGSTLRDGQYVVSRDPDRCTEFFEDFLARTEIDHVDVLFLHNCNTPEDCDAVLAPGGLHDLAKLLCKQGKARFIGLSSHSVPTALRVIESGAIDVLMFPINLASYAVPGKQQLMAACSEHNVGLVAMKAFGGGSLLRDKRVIELEDYQMGRQEMAGAASHYAKPANITPIQCLAYVLDQQDVTTVVPGCRSVVELNGVLGYYSANSKQRDYAPILPAFAEFATGECVYCNHCLPCPARIDIGGLIRLLEQALDGLTDELRDAYANLASQATDCTRCEQCSKRCPFGVDVVAKMVKAHEVFEI